MKRLIAILFLLTFVLQSTSQLWIRGIFYANREYIAQNLCINRFDAIPLCKGSCYLEQKLQQDKEQQQQSAPELKVKEVQWFCQQVRFEPILAIPYTFIILPDFNLFKDQFIPQGYLPSVFHPPSVMV